MNRYRIVCCLFVFTTFLVGIQICFAQPLDSTRHPVLQIGTKQIAPFAIKDNEGRWRGISIEFWKEIATELNVNYEFKETDLAGILAGVKNGSLDIGIAAISITPEREKILDFSHPYFTSGLGIAVSSSGQGSIIKVLTRYINTDFFILILILFSLTLVMGTLVWLLERNKNKEQFGGSWHKGIISGIWWSAVTLTTVGYGDKTPSTVAGRLVALLWMFSAIVLVSIFTASITSSLTVTELESSIKGPEDLIGAKVVTVAGSTSEKYLKEHQLVYKSVATASEGLREIALGKSEAMVYDAPVLQYLCKTEYNNKLSVLPNVFEKQYYGIVLPQNTALRKEINQAILKLLDKTESREIFNRYLGK